MLQAEKFEAVTVLTLDRPERHNSLVPAFLQQLLAALNQLAQQDDLRAVMLQANGRTFSTGGDLSGFKENLDWIDQYAHQLVGLLNKVILALLDLPVPVVAAVQGAVTGGSLGLVLACDLVFVSPQASFTPYYSVVGFSPDGGWTAMLPDVIGTRRAAQVLLTNQTITAEQALEWGLVNRLLPAEKLRSEALDVAQQIAAAQPGSSQHSKRLLNANRAVIAARLDQELAHFVEQIRLAETQQSMLAFLDKMKKSN